MDKELYKQLRKCYKVGINFYWGRRDDVDADGLCFAYGDEDKRNNSCDHLMVRDTLMAIFGESYHYVGQGHRRRGGIFQLALTVSREEYEEMMSAILNEEKMVSEEKLECAVQKRYKHLLVPHDWLYIHGKNEDIMENRDVLNVLREGYIIKFANTFCTPKGIAFMSITFELENRSEKGEF